MAKKQINIRIDETILAQLDGWREKERVSIDRTAVIEAGIGNFLQINDDPDGPIEILEDMLSYYSDAAPTQCRYLAEKSLQSVAADLVKYCGMEPDEIAEMAQKAAQNAQKQP